MAGNYVDIPGPRIAYDRDGTGVFVYSTSGALSELDGPTKRILNSEFKAGINTIFMEPNALACWVFPHAMDLNGFWFLANTSPFFHSDQRVVETSPDTTNGQDGTWTTWMANPPFATNNLASPSFRSEIQVPVSGSVSGVKGFRLRAQAVVQLIVRNTHLYGSISAATNRIEFWRPTDDQAMNGPHLDWGDRPRGTEEIRKFRIKNMSSSLTAHDTVISLEALADVTTPASFVSQHTLQYPDGVGGWLNSIVIPTLAPGQISQQIAIKQNLLLGAPVGLWNQRLLAIPTSWT